VSVIYDKNEITLRAEKELYTEKTVTLTAINSIISRKVTVKIGEPTSSVEVKNIGNVDTLKSMHDSIRYNCVVDHPLGDTL
jgi:hypothetical protein